MASCPEIVRRVKDLKSHDKGVSVGRSEPNNIPLEPRHYCQIMPLICSCTSTNAGHLCFRCLYGMVLRHGLAAINAAALGVSVG